jgi:hypothetical protein
MMSSRKEKVQTEFGKTRNPARIPFQLKSRKVKTRSRLHFDKTIDGSFGSASDLTSFTSSE